MLVMTEASGHAKHRVKENGPSPMLSPFIYHLLTHHNGI